MSQTPSMQVETGHCFTSEEIREIFGEEWRKAWMKIAEGIFQRDGTDQNHSGQRIAQNPLLQEAIKVIRDEYFDLLTKKMPIIKKMRDIPSDLVDQHTDLLQQMYDINDDLVFLNVASLARLQQPNYGFDDEKAAQLLDGVNRTEINQDLDGLSPRTAAALVGSIVGRAIDAFQSIFPAQNYPRMEVPNDFDGRHSLLSDAQTEGRVMPAPPDFGQRKGN